MSAQSMTVGPSRWPTRRARRWRRPLPAILLGARASAQDLGREVAVGNPRRSRQVRNDVDERPRLELERAWVRGPDSFQHAVGVGLGERLAASGVASAV